MTTSAPRSALREVAELLHAKLYAPASARERRVAELGLLSALLSEIPQPPGRPPLVPRQLYDERRIRDAPSAPLSARLTERYSSWRRACYAAWSLLPDGRWNEGGVPWATSAPGKPRPRSYTREDAIASLQLAAQTLGRTPSSTAYTRWRQNRINNARARGETIRLASYHRIVALLAPDPPPRAGWRAACATALSADPNPPPKPSA